MNLDNIRKAYQHATGTWTGCDWPTRFGKTGLNLESCTAPEALCRAAEGRGPEALDWASAAEWLDSVEENSEQAEVQAAVALAAANAGDLEEALEHAERACALEAQTGRTRAQRCQPVWQRLRHAIKQTLQGERQSPAAAEKAETSSLAQELQGQVRTLRAEVDRLNRRVGQLESLNHTVACGR